MRAEHSKLIPQQCTSSAIGALAPVAAVALLVLQATLTAAAASYPKRCAGTTSRRASTRSCIAFANADAAKAAATTTTAEAAAAPAAATAAFALHSLTTQPSHQH